MEYYADVKYWHEDGYAYAINQEFACPLINDFAKILRRYCITCECEHGVFVCIIYEFTGTL